MDLQPLFPFPVIRQDPGHREPEGFVMGHIPDMAEFMDHHIGNDLPRTEYQRPGEAQFPFIIAVPPAGSQMVFQGKNYENFILLLQNRY